LNYTENKGIIEMEWLCHFLVYLVVLESD
jgi:hypothetical protein